MEKKIKVVWICSVSNSMLRKHLDLGFPLWYRLIKRALGKNIEEVADYAHWNSNAINEFKNINDVELHVIFVHRQMKRHVQQFTDNNIYYYAIKEDDNSIIGYIRNRIFGDQWLYNRSNQTIANLVKRIRPDLVHMQGAEMLAHSPSLLLLPCDIPNIVQLETMLHDPVVLHYSPQLARQKECEFKVINRADYIGNNTAHFHIIVRKFIKKDAVFVKTRLMLAEPANLTPCEKNYDFVYFANYINKSVDLAIEAFGIAHRNKPDLTLDVIGSASEEEIGALRKRLEELGCKEAVVFEGKLPTHEDVIAQIRKARFALLPLKVDSVSGTIREAMWNGIPVVTTRTVGTPSLNEKRESVMISEIGDHNAMAENMIRLIKDKSLAETLRKNAAITVDEYYGNNPLRAREWVEAYYACIDNFKNGKPIAE